MQWLCFAVLQILKLLLGIWLIRIVFPEVPLRTGIRRILAGMLLAVIAYIQISDYWLAFASYLVPLTTALLSALICILAVEKERFSVFVTGWLYIMTTELLKIPCLVLKGIYYEQTLYWANYAGRDWIEAAWSAGILLLFALLLWKKKDFFASVQRLLEKMRKSVFLLGAAEWVLLTGVMWMGGKQAYSTSALMMLFLGVFCILLLLLYLFLLLVWRDAENEKNIMAASQTLLLKHHKELQEIYAKNNQRMHDTKHVILYLKNCIQEDRLEDALQQIDMYTENLQSAERTVWTGFDFPDFLINTKKAEMDARKISFELEVDLTHIPVSDADMSILLGNLLDNAIEAAEKCDADKRNIFLKMCNRNEMFYLRIYNTSVHAPKIRNGRFLSTKEGDAHGYGIENVKNIALKYQGSIDFQYTSNMFEVTILI